MKNSNKYVNLFDIIAIYILKVIIYPDLMIVFTSLIICSVYEILKRYKIILFILSWKWKTHISIRFQIQFWLEKEFNFNFAIIFVWEFQVLSEVIMTENLFCRADNKYNKKNCSNVSDILTMDLH